MSKVHLAYVPRHVGCRTYDLQPGGDALLVHLVHVVHPDRHPDALVALFVSLVLKCGRVCAAAAGLPAPPGRERCKLPCPIQPRQRSEAFPSPAISSSPLLKPRDRAGEVGHVQYRSQTFGFHNRRRITPGGLRNLTYRCTLAISVIEALASLTPVCAEIDILRLSDESVAERIPCPASVLRLFTVALWCKLGTPERVRVKTAHIPESKTRRRFCEKIRRDIRSGIHAGPVSAGKRRKSVVELCWRQ